MASSLRARNVAFLNSLSRLFAAPLKGIPKQAPFRNPTAPIVFSPTGNRTPILSSKVPLCKERGVKVPARFYK